MLHRLFPFCKGTAGSRFRQHAATKTYSKRGHLDQELLEGAAGGGDMAVGIGGAPTLQHSVALRRRQGAILRGQGVGSTLHGLPTNQGVQHVVPRCRQGEPGQNSGPLTTMTCTFQFGNLQAKFPQDFVKQRLASSCAGQGSSAAGGVQQKLQDYGFVVVSKVPHRSA
jgi:hypothetical protein